MLVTLIFFCAAGAIILIAFSAFAGFHDLWDHPDHPGTGPESHLRNGRQR